MILGLSVETFTALHVAISLIAIAAGLVALPMLAAGRWSGPGQTTFLIATAATSVTGFFFPISALTPALVFGVVSLILLALAALALATRGGWSAPGYAISAAIAQYLNMVVLVVQAFQKLPALQPLAPTQSEPPFLIAQAAVLALCLLLGWRATVGARRVFGGAAAASMP